MNSARPMEQLEIFSYEIYYLARTVSYVMTIIISKQGILAVRRYQMSCPLWSYHWPEIGLSVGVLINSKHEVAPGLQSHSNSS